MRTLCYSINLTQKHDKTDSIESIEFNWNLRSLCRAIYSQIVIANSVAYGGDPLHFIRSFMHAILLFIFNWPPTFNTNHLNAITITMTFTISSNFMFACCDTHIYVEYINNQWIQNNRHIYIRQLLKNQSITCISSKKKFVLCFIFSEMLCRRLSFSNKIFIHRWDQ